MNLIENTHYKRQRQFLKNNFNKLVALIFYGLLIVYFVNNKQALQDLWNVPLLALLLLLCLKASRIMVSGLFTKITLNVFGKNISIKETNYLSLLSSLGNFFGPILGGAGVRAVYLKKKHGFEYSKFISTLYGYFVVSFISNATISVLAIIFFWNARGMVNGMLLALAIFGVIIIGNLLLIIIPPHVAQRLIDKLAFMPLRIKNILQMIIEGWLTIRGNHRLLLRLFILNVIIFGLVVVESFILYKLFVPEFLLINLVIYTGLNTVSTLVSFTPGAMGIKEGLFILTNSLLALSSAQIIQIATIDRSVTFLLLVITYLFIKLTKFDQKVKNLQSIS